ncbi:cache domain-containing sensor histidine kinase [Paenibacillus elgii]|uniref:cache domain-containing sensor histidine kinase n=1 Tax=Paenibacillus elgii TaxID=189691 RepID=UPI00203D68E3|nr:cache domain-containing protein [Paenibacillus elgii]MCM3270199.1 histidine kinase [Paenibacillus elgii]
MKRASLYQKLFLYFLTVIIVSLTTVGIVTYYASSQELDRMVEGQLSQMVGNAAYHTDLYLKSYERSMVSLLTNKEVKRFIDLPAGLEGYEFYEIQKQIKEYVIDPIFIRNPEITAVYSISFNGNAVYYYNEVTGSSFTPEQIKEQLAFFKTNTSAYGSLSVLNRSIIESQNNRTITLVRQIRGLTSSEPQGILAIALRSAELSELWKGIELTSTGFFFIVDERGRIVYHPQRERIGETVQPELKRSIVESGLQSFVAEENGERRLYQSRKSSYSGWHLVVSMPMAELRKPVDTIRVTSIVVGLFTLVFALWLAFRFGKSITGPIRTLKEGMRETEKGNWATIPLPEQRQRDEIVELMIRYNLMVNRLSELVDKVYQAELKNHEIQLERQKAEFQSLQLQINPHFLYNTLETIVCYAFVEDSDEISEIVRALAYMLRYSVQTNLEEITVANELKHVLNFMIVLKHRVGREFEIDVAVKPELLLHKMVRLTLQPLVENVFQHAFEGGVEDYHCIRIDAGEGDGTFWVSVEDNGNGMPEDRLAEVREKLEANRLVDGGDDAPGKKGGIGIVNVHRRIQMVFGEQYGLHIESRLDEGTKVTMVMPSTGRPLG